MVIQYLGFLFTGLYIALHPKVTMNYEASSLYVVRGVFPY